LQKKIIEPAVVLLLSFCCVTHLYFMSLAKHIISFPLFRLN